MKSLENDYINNNFITPNLNKIENNILGKKFVTENNNNGNINFHRKFNNLKKEIRIIS